MLKGFGAADDELGQVLREVDVDYFSNSLCDERYRTELSFGSGAITDSMMCTMTPGKSTCDVSPYCILFLFNHIYLREQFVW